MIFFFFNFLPVVDPEVKITYAGREERKEEEEKGEEEAGYGKDKESSSQRRNTSTSSPPSSTTPTLPTTSHPSSPNFSLTTFFVEIKWKQTICFNNSRILGGGNETSNKTNIFSAKIAEHIKVMFVTPRGRRIGRVGGRGEGEEEGGKGRRWGAVERERERREEKEREQWGEWMNRWEWVEREVWRECLREGGWGGRGRGGEGEGKGELARRIWERGVEGEERDRAESREEKQEEIAGRLLIQS